MTRAERLHALDRRIYQLVTVARLATAACRNDEPALVDVLNEKLDKALDVLGVLAAALEDIGEELDFQAGKVAADEGGRDAAPQ